MDLSKRTFLKFAGCSLVGAAGLQGVPAGTTGKEVEAAQGATRQSTWGMVIDLKLCRDRGECDACRRACHETHNVPEIQDKEEEIKWIWKESFEHTFPTQHHEFLPESTGELAVLVTCNHCESPPCVRVCPTQATWKREEDGLVMMDQHRCIGCRYCMVACPYGARSFNWRDPRPLLGEKRTLEYPTRTAGVVEKCNFCAERLAEGKIPACVEACRKTGAGAMVFGDLADPDSAIRRLLDKRFSLRRKPELGTAPRVFYLI